MSATISITIKNYAEIEQLFTRMPERMIKALDTAVERCILKIQSDAMKEAPVNKQSGGGNLRQSIKAMMTGPASGKVEVGASYGIYVHEGTAPHIIRIVNKRVLANRRTNQVFGTIVHHPGTKANPFLQRAVDKNSDFIDKQFENAVDEALK